MLEERRYSWLLATLLGLFAFHSLVPEDGPMRLALVVVGFAVAGAALRAVWAHRRLALLAFVTGLVGAGLQFLGRRSAGLDLPAVGEGLNLLFLSLLAAVILTDVLRSRRVTMDTVFGAACVYLLLGMLWTKIFVLVEWFAPGSFDPSPLAAAAVDDGYGMPAALDTMMYFSFVTLTTVGYGDITPVGSTARSFAMLEGLIGQLFIAIMIARLVGLQAAAEATARKGLPR